MGPHCLLQSRLMGRYVKEMQLMLTPMTNISVQKNIWDPDQTAPRRSGSTLIATKTRFNNNNFGNSEERFCRTEVHIWYKSEEGMCLSSLV